MKLILAFVVALVLVAHVSATVVGLKDAEMAELPFSANVTILKPVGDMPNGSGQAKRGAIKGAILGAIAGGVIGKILKNKSSVGGIG
jgi:hypothetical protein